MSGCAFNRSTGIGEREKTERAQSSHVSLIRQELVTLAGNHSRAVILNQLLYWTQRTRDFSFLIEEERKRCGKEQDVPQYGWIYKTADELIEETLLQVDRTTIRRHLNFLIKKEWLFERSNPQNKWDRTTQYRVNVCKVQKDLMNLDLSLSEIASWRLEDVCAKGPAPSRGQNNPSNVYIFPSHRQEPLKPAETSNGQNPLSKGHNARSSGQNARCNTETTTEITNREHTHKGRAREIFNHDFFEEGLRIWKTTVGQDVHLTEKRKQQLTCILERHFQSDLAQWGTFCLRLKASPFLMGEGTRRWRVSLDWILIEENLLKVLEGNFDDPEAQDREEFKHLQGEKTKKVLDSIADPLWKEWCTQWAQGIWLNESQVVIDPLSCSDLERIANAHFLEVEDERLVWIGSTDQAVLNKIEDLRLPLYSLISRTFPNFRTIRTRLIETLPTHQPQSTTQEKTPC